MSGEKKHHILYKLEIFLKMSRESRQYQGPSGFYCGTSGSQKESLKLPLQNEGGGERVAPCPVFNKTLGALLA